MSKEMKNIHGWFRWRWALASALVVSVALTPAAALAAPPSGGNRVALTTATGSALVDLGRQGSVSDDGKLVAFTSFASDLPDSNGIPQAYVKNLDAGSVESLSVGFDGKPADAAVEYPVLSADGRFAAFVSAANNLVRGFDSHGVSQLYRKNLATGDIVPVSVQGDSPTEGAQDGVVGTPAISGDGDRVAFSTILPARGLVTPHAQIYLRFVSWRETVLLSQRGGNPGLSPSREPSLSRNGRYVAWVSADLNIIGGHGTGNSQALAIDLDNFTAGPYALSTAPDGTLGNASTSRVDISDIGSAVLISTATNLTGTRLSGRTERAYFHPGGGPGSRLVSHATTGPTSDGGSVDGRARISADGARVVYTSHSDRLTDEGGNGSLQVLCYETSAATNHVVSLTSKGAVASGDSYFPEITADGDYVFYVTESEDLLPGEGIKPPRSLILQNLP